jgi:membrane protein required for colicin V production
MLDVIFLVLLVIGTYAGYKKGFILEVIGILAFFLGIFGAFKLLTSGTNLLVRIIPEYSNIVPLILFIVIFIFIIILVNLFGRMLKKIIDMTILGVFDRAAGAILGFFMWTFLISLVLWLVGQAGFSLPENQVKNSYVYPYIVNFAPTVGGYFSSLFPFAATLVQDIKEMFIK